MGIDFHLYKLLRWQAAKEPLGNVLTIGRLGLNVSSRVLGKDLPGANIHGPYSESLLYALGADSVRSVDVSNYESPTFTADLNMPVRPSFRFLTVIDGGSLEHVFDIAQAFRNLVNFCEIGGRIFHALPVNNLSGHGFWQFSSDLLYSLYSEVNGFANTKVFYASTLQDKFWHLAPPPRSGSRVEMVSIEPVILLCVSTKTNDVEFANPIQPYYLGTWDNEIPDTKSSLELLGRNLVHGARQIDKNIFNILRNVLLIAGLASGFGRYSICSSRFRNVRIANLIDSGI